MASRLLPDAAGDSSSNHSRQEGPVVSGWYAECCRLWSLPALHTTAARPLPIASPSASAMLLLTWGQSAEPSTNARAPRRFRGVWRDPGICPMATTVIGPQPARPIAKRRSQLRVVAATAAASSAPTPKRRSLLRQGLTYLDGNGVE
jgi:hypothetical protein